MHTEEIRLNWVATGPQSAPTVVLIHAVGYDLTYWDRQIDALRLNFRVVAFDLPGHGRSAPPADGWSFPGFAELVGTFIASLDAGPVHLVGLSFGGMVAQATVLAHPEVVQSLTLIGTACTFAEPARTAMKARAAAVRSGGMAAVLTSSLDRWFMPETRTARPHLIDRVSKTVLGDDPEVHASIWDMIAGFDVQERLCEIRCPTLVLVGERDPSTPPAAAKLLVERISGAQMMVIPGASHILPLEAPEAVNAKLLEFLATT